MNFGFRVDAWLAQMEADDAGAAPAAGRLMRTPIGTHGVINTRREGGRVVAETRVRDLDGRLRQVRASWPTAAAARARLIERIRE